MKLFQTPHFRVSYRGEAEYLVGQCDPEKGDRTVTIRYNLWHEQICIYNDLNYFWDVELPSVGLVLQRSSAWGDDYLFRYPQKEVMAMFPKYKAGRCSKDFRIECENWPMLVATAFSFEPEHTFTGNSEIIWRGIAPEMSKEIWFERIFPHLYPPVRSQIVREFQRRGASIPKHPAIAPQPYIHSFSPRPYQTRFEIRLDRLYQPTQYFADDRWSDDPKDAILFLSQADAEVRLNNLPSIALPIAQHLTAK